MAYSIWMLEKNNIVVSGGQSLDGFTQGDGSHLVGQTITLNNRDWIETRIRDKVRISMTTTPAKGYRKARRTTERPMPTTPSSKPNTSLCCVTRAPASNTPPSATTRTVPRPLMPRSKGGPSSGAKAASPLGVALAVVSAAESTGQPRIDAGDVAYLICFAAGILITTPEGPRGRDATSRPAILTSDQGAQPLAWVGVAWVGVTRVDAARLAALPVFRPVRIRADAFGPGSPSRDTFLSQKHGFLVVGWRAELLFGGGEVLVAARHLVDDDRVTIAHDLDGVTQVHLMFDGHQVVESNGLAAESFPHGPQAVLALDRAPRDDLLALFPELAEGVTAAPRPARALLRGWEGEMLSS
jgi:hypothetical protein